MTELVQAALPLRASASRHMEGQDSVTLLGSEFEPDIVIVRGAARDDVGDNLVVADLALVIEISDSTSLPVTRASEKRFTRKRASLSTGSSTSWIVALRSTPTRRRRTTSPIIASDMTMARRMTFRWSSASRKWCGSPCGRFCRSKGSLISKANK